ncbi:MAG: hypothetical protein PHU06_09050 [Gallionella sp.]|nr:hypothetical protein [Gallionella sp.]MDD4959087.1 hypothetical protein [Gallionella sp.]
MSNLSEDEQLFANIVQAAQFLTTDPEACAESAAIAADFSVANDEVWAMIESDEVAIDEAINPINPTH